MVGESTAAAQSALDEPKGLLENAGLSVTAELVTGEPVRCDQRARKQANNSTCWSWARMAVDAMRSMFIGSTTTEMLISCRVPVLLFR